MNRLALLVAFSAMAMVQGQVLLRDVAVPPSIKGTLRTRGGRLVNPAVIEVLAPGSSVPVAKGEFREGEFTFEDVPDGLYTVAVRGDLFYPMQFTEVQVRFLQTVVLDVVLNQQTITGFNIETIEMVRLLGHLGEARRGSGVRVCFASEKYKRCAISAASGRFFIELVPDSYRVTYERGGEVVEGGMRNYGRADWWRERFE